MTTTRPPVPETASVMPSARLLIVDDEPAVRRTLGGLFRHLGYQVVEADSGPAALDYLAHQSVDLVILDLKMPGMDGTEVLQAAHPRMPGTVFIILTAHGTLDSAIVALRHGAFDYLLKPSTTAEIVRAVEAGLAERLRRLRRGDPIDLLEQALTRLKATAQPPASAPAVERFLQTPEITVDTLRRLVVVRGQPVDLTPTEFDILAYLVRHPDRVVSCRELVAHVRDFDLDERDARRYLRSHVHRLRQKVEPNPSQPRLILTARSSGYILAVDPTHLTS